MNERPRFCKGCPRLPKGVVAEICGVELMTQSKLRQDGVELKDYNSTFAPLVARVDTVVVEVTEDLGIEPGDEGQMYVMAGAATRNDIADRVANCHGAVGRFRKDCAAIETKSVVSIIEI